MKMMRKLLKKGWFLTLFLCFACGGVSSENSTVDSITTEGPSKSITVDGNTYYAGYGVDVLKDTAKSPYAISGTVICDNEVTPTAVTVDFIENNSEITKSRSKSVSFGGSGTVKMVTVGGSYTNTNTEQITLTNRSIVIAARVHMDKCTYSIENEKLTERGAAALAEGIDSFVNQFGTAYVKKAKLSADVIYYYKFDYKGTILKDESTYKNAVKASVLSYFSSSVSYTLTNSNKTDISNSKISCAASSSVPYVFPVVQSFEEWTEASNQFNDYVLNPDNLPYFQPSEVEYQPYSAIAEMPDGYAEKYNSAEQGAEWIEQWRTHRDSVTDTYQFTTSSELQAKCQTALAKIDAEILKIEKNDAEAKAPRENEAQLLMKSDSILMPDLIYYNSFDNEPVVSSYSYCDSANNYYQDATLIWDTLNVKGNMQTGCLYDPSALSYEILYRTPDNALQVSFASRYRGSNVVELYPFTSEQKNMLKYVDERSFKKGTVSFLTQTVGQWRGVGDYTYAWADVYFYLSEDTYFLAHQPVTASGIHKYNSNYTDFYMVVNGTSYPVLIGSPSSNIDQILLQWDTTVSSGYVNVFINGEQIANISADPKTLQAAIANYTQKFYLHAYVENRGDRTATAHAFIEKVQIYSEIKQPTELL